MISGAGERSAQSTKPEMTGFVKQKESASGAVRNGTSRSIQSRHPYLFVASHAPKYAQTSVTTVASVRTEKRGLNVITTHDLVQRLAGYSIRFDSLSSPVLNITFNLAFE